MTEPTTFPDAPKPSAKDVKRRTNLLVQGWRFAKLNTKMILMVTKGHH